MKNGHNSGDTLLFLLALRTYVDISEFDRLHHFHRRSLDRISLNLHDQIGLQWLQIFPLDTLIFCIPTLFSNPPGGYIFKLYACIISVLAYVRNHLAISLVAFPAMDLAAIFKACNVQATFAGKILENGWTAELFSMMNFDHDLEEVLEETAGALTPLQWASLKLSWTKCQNSATPPAVPTSAAPASSSASPDHGTTWTETFAPKLTSTTVAALKAKFRADYPAEVLTLETTPSLRLLSMVHHQHSKGDHKWIAWKFRLSQSKADDIAASKSQRVPKSESMSLHSMLLDDPPIMEIQNGGLGLRALRSLFETLLTWLA